MSLNAKSHRRCIGQIFVANRIKTERQRKAVSPTPDLGGPGQVKRGNSRSGPLHMKKPPEHGGNSGASPVP